MYKKILVTGSLFVGIFLGIAVYSLYASVPLEYIFIGTPQKSHLFAVQSIDTMKYSRDMAGQVLDNPQKFKTIVDGQMQLIEDAGATHVAIDTPYDERFLPVLKLWVDSARAHHLSVWFRGNFSGWEGWFDYQKIGRAEHERLLTTFIQNNRTLFADGDIFTPCPECENGGPGDPRQTGDAAGYRTFLIGERALSLKEFRAMGKSVTVYNSMNGDIARDIITPETVKSLGGTILVDHYVKTTETFSNDVASIAKKQNAQVGLGEFGAPIPDLNGTMTPTAQAKYVGAMLRALYFQSNLVPVVNYWTLRGGSTAIVDDTGKPLPAYFMLQSYFKAPFVSGKVFNSLGEPLSGAKIFVASTTYSSLAEGSLYQVFLPESYRTIIVEHTGYKSVTVTLSAQISTSTVKDFYLEPISPSRWFKIRQLLYDTAKKLKALSLSI